MKAERVHAMLTRHGVRAEIVQRVDSTSTHPLVWVPSQDYVRAVELMTQMSEGGPLPCDTCPEEREGRFDVCWMCQER